MFVAHFMKLVRRSPLLGWNSEIQQVTVYITCNMGFKRLISLITGPRGAGADDENASD